MKSAGRLLAVALLGAAWVASPALAQANEYETLNWTPVEAWGSGNVLWVASFDLATATGGERSPLMRLRFLWAGDKVGGERAEARYSVSEMIFDCEAVTVRHTARSYDDRGQMLDTLETPERPAVGFAMPGDPNPPKDPLFRIACEGEMPEITGPPDTLDGVLGAG